LGASKATNEWKCIRETRQNRIKDLARHESCHTTNFPQD
jgi:hypothetical protein